VDYFFFAFFLVAFFFFATFFFAFFLAIQQPLLSFVAVATSSFTAFTVITTNLNETWMNSKISLTGDASFVKGFLKNKNFSGARSIRSRTAHRFRAMRVSPDEDREAKSMSVKQRSGSPGRAKEK